VTAQQLAQAQAEVRQIFIHPDLMAYATAIGEATRHDGEIELGASPRAIVHLLLAAQGFAATAGRDYVLPDDVKEAAVPTLAHRLVMKNDFYRTRGHDEEIIQRLLEQVSVPTEAIDFSRLSR
jgi:MoxR-like ATPase